MAAVRPGRVLFAVGAGTLFTSVTSSTVSLALPAVGRDLGVTLELSRWVMLAFLVIVTALLPVAGRAGDMLSHRTIFRSGYVLLGLASLLCGLAPSFALLVAGRVLQGVAGAMVMVAGPALLTTSFPGKERGRALGMLATCTYIGLSSGPLVGGLIISAWGWRSTFLVNVPLSVVIFAIGLACLPPPPKRAERAGFDVGGAVAMLLGLPLLLLSVAEGQRFGWTSWQTLGGAGAGAAILALFVRIESRRSYPLVDLGLFRSRVFSLAALAALGNYLALFVPNILLPFLLVEGRGLPPATAGLVLSAQPVAMALVATPSGWASDRLGSRGLSTFGMLLVAAGLAGLSLTGPGTAIQVIAACSGVVGLGTGIFISPNSSALMGAAPQSRQGIAGSLVALSRNLGMMMGVAAATAVFRAAGGTSGHPWSASDYRAFEIAILVAAVVAVLSAACSAFKGEESPT
ncbi:MAG: MFS transporter [Deltaproteobacteria bacterium]|nr:MFS transporter [Deltaproteobacteria bacterium]